MKIIDTATGFTGRAWCDSLAHGAQEPLPESSFAVLVPRSLCHTCAALDPWALIAVEGLRQQARDLDRRRVHEFDERQKLVRLVRDLGDAVVTCDRCGEYAPAESVKGGLCESCAEDVARPVQHGRACRCDQCAAQAEDAYEAKREDARERAVRA